MIEVPFTPFGRRAAPFLDVFLMAVGPGTPFPFRAQLDTGADRSVIPQSVADQLRLSEDEAIHYQSVDGGIGVLQTYRLILRVKSFRPVVLTPAASEHEQHILLGRDLSNKYRILLDGRARLLQIGEYPPA